MHDANNLEQRGIPTVTIAHDNFVAAARAQARVLGRPNLKLAVMPRPMPTWDADTQRAVCARLYRQVLEGLLDHVPAAAR
ncbi:MAG: hypothetical protein HYY00_00465 [Chloroflexi bacterium]|nr:hypothetical protein [Chloroflexota bacterium]